MWITKNIVELHHGALSCFSEGLGKGCTMRLTLPVLTRSSDDLQNEPFQNAHQKSTVVELLECEKQHCGLHKKVLVVDDSTMCRKMVTRLLRNMSYECVEATNGMDCIEKVTSSNGEEQCGSGDQVDFILLDFEMPIMNGPTACKILRELGLTLPIIGLTGNVLTEDTDYFTQCGADAVITKPFAIKDFLEVIQKY